MEYDMQELERLAKEIDFDLDDYRGLRESTQNDIFDEHNHNVLFEYELEDKDNGISRGHSVICDPECTLKWSEKHSDGIDTYVRTGKILDTESCILGTLIECKIVMVGEYHIYTAKYFCEVEDD